MGQYSPAFRLYLIATWNLFIVLTGYATYLSLVPDPGDAFATVWDKLLHVACWFVITLSLRAAWPRFRLPWWAVFTLLLYSLLIEVLQHFAPVRQFDFYDLVSNGVGILLAYALSLVVWPSIDRRLIRRLRQPQE